jgi:excisionase family DNA binding protein
MPRNNGQENNTMTVKQAAAHFNVHPSTIQRWIQKGHFPEARKRGPESNSPYIIPAANIAALDEKLNQITGE